MRKWIQSAVANMKKSGTIGAFTRQAKSRGMSPLEFARKVRNNPSAYDKTTIKRAIFALNANKR